MVICVLSTHTSEKMYKDLTWATELGTLVYLINVQHVLINFLKTFWMTIFFKPLYKDFFVLNQCHWLDK